FPYPPPSRSAPAAGCPARGRAPARAARAVLRVAVRSCARRHFRAHGRTRHFRRGTYAKHAADGDGELGAVERIEMKLLHALGMQRMTKLDGNACGHQLPGVRIIVEIREQPRHPGGNARATAFAEV